MTTCHSTKLTSRGGKGSSRTSSAKSVSSTSNNNGSTSNIDGSLEKAGLTADQLALYNVVHAQMEAQKKAAAATEDEGMWILIFAGSLDS